eukprot:m.133971 g.133971  ORF g.133971 m.133971 type:complete len:1017 (-) comp11371_c0_seq3:78-3128(-)
MASIEPRDGNDAAPCCETGCCGDDIVFTSDEEDTGQDTKANIASARTGGAHSPTDTTDTTRLADATEAAAAPCCASGGCCGDDIVFTSDEEDAGNEVELKVEGISEETTVPPTAVAQSNNSNAITPTDDHDTAIIGDVERAAAGAAGAVTVPTQRLADETETVSVPDGSPTPPNDTNSLVPAARDLCGCGDCCETEKESGCGLRDVPKGPDGKPIQGACCCGFPGERDEKSTTIRIQNMCCEQEASLIRKLVANQVGVTKVTISVIGRLAVVDHCRFPCCLSPDALVASLNKAKLGASIRESGTAGVTVPFSVDTRLRVELLFVWTILVLSLILLAPSDDNLTEASEYLALVGTCLGGARVMYLALLQLWYHTIGMYVLVGLAIVGTVILGILGDHEAWVDGCILVAVFLAVEQLEAWYMHQVAKALHDVGVSTVTETAVLAGGQTISVDEIVPGMVVAVRAGESVPVDGTVVTGTGAVDESAITGESIPLHKEVGSTVLGGTVCQQGYLEVKAETCGTGTVLQKIVALLARAQGEKTKSQTVIERFVKFYTPAVLLCALIYGVVCGETSSDSGHCVKAALVVLILACPCALVAAAPSPVAFGTAAAVRGGAVVKSPQAFEDLASCRTVVFDKTGTLTEGSFDVVSECWLRNQDAQAKQRIWDLVCALQVRSTHPIAASIVRHATGCVAEAYEADIASDAAACNVDKFRTRPGVGVAGVVTLPHEDVACHVKVGNLKVIEWAKMTLDTVAKDMSARFLVRCPDSTIIYVVVDGVLEAIVALSDVIRKDSYGTVARLHKRGIETIMLTGDRIESAQRVCNELGITDFKAGLKPEDKLDCVTERVKRGERVLMVGDGMNDGPSLAAATVGVAMGAGGTAMAVESASVVMVRDEIGTIPDLISLSQRCKARIRENIVLAVSIKIVFVGLALSDTLASLWIAVVVDAVSVLLVLANSGRGLRSFNSKSVDTLGHGVDDDGGGGGGMPMAISPVASAGVAAPLDEDTLTTPLVSGGQTSVI